MMEKLLDLQPEARRSAVRASGVLPGYSPPRRLPLVSPDGGRLFQRGRIMRQQESRRRPQW